VQLALAQIQTSYTLDILAYTESRLNKIKKWEIDENGFYHVNVTDSAELAALTDLKLYAGMKVFDYNNLLVLSCGWLCSFMSNYLWYSTYVKEKVRKYMGDCEEYDSEAEMKVRRAALRELLGGDKDDSFVAQLSVFDHYKRSFDRWSDAEQKIPEVMADSSLTEEDKKSFVRNSCLSGMHPIYMSAMTHPYIHNKAEIFCAEKLTKNLTWELPKENVAADIVRSIAARYPGRYLVIDFWGMGCGPCRSEIQASKDVRSKIAKRDDVKLVYIADENIAGGSESYRKYVAEWLDGEETMCVSDVTFNAMEELFEFTAIPHKVIITPEGLVVDDALSVSMHDFDNSFENVKKRLNK
jgi:thiol-disulfide isomerase/thioredoxin